MLKDILEVCKAGCASVIFSLVYALVFACITTLFGVPSSAVVIVNQVFKIVAIVLGGMLFLRGERGLLKGAAHGMSVVIQTWMLFSTIACSFEIGWTLLLEIVIGAFAGGITGVIAVNVKKT